MKCPACGGKLVKVNGGIFGATLAKTGRRGGYICLKCGRWWDEKEAKEASRGC